jgi:hypothetical protein
VVDLEVYQLMNVDLNMNVTLAPKEWRGTERQE